MKKVFVIKNIKTNKYYTEANSSYGGWSKNIFKAAQYDLSWVKESNSNPDWALEKNERWVEVIMKEK